MYSKSTKYRLTFPNRLWRRKPPFSPLTSKTRFWRLEILSLDLLKFYFLRLFPFLCDDRRVYLRGHHTSYMMKIRKLKYLGTTFYYGSSDENVDFRSGSLCEYSLLDPFSTSGLGVLTLPPVKILPRLP